MLFIDVSLFSYVKIRNVVFDKKKEVKVVLGRV